MAIDISKRKLKKQLAAKLKNKMTRQMIIKGIRQNINKELQGHVLNTFKTHQAKKILMNSVLGKFTLTRDQAA